MNKITQIFIIGASSVIILAGLNWIASKIAMEHNINGCVDTAIKLGYGEGGADREQLRDNCVSGIYHWWR